MCLLAFFQGLPSLQLPLIGPLQTAYDLRPVVHPQGMDAGPGEGADPTGVKAIPEESNGIPALDGEQLDHMDDLIHALG